MLVLGIALLASGGPIVRHFIRQQLPLDNPNKLVFKVWRDSSYDGISVKRRFFVYHVNNPEAVVNEHARPDMIRQGPYVFRETQYSPEDDIFYGPDGTVGYVYRDFLTFVPEESIDKNGNVLSLDDLVTAPNMPFFALMHRLSFFPGELSRSLACDVLSPRVNAVGPTGIFVQRSVKELLFGYYDPLFQEFAGLVKDLKIDYHVPTYFRFLWNGSLPAPSPVSHATGQRCPVWDDMSVCNQTSVNVSRVWSGGGWGVEAPVDPEATEAEVRASRHGITDLPRGVDWVGSHAHWAGQDRMWWWGAPETHGGDCQDFAGGAGMTYPPGMGSASTPYVFVDCIYRKIRLAFTDSGTVKGVPAMRFVIHPSELQLGGPNEKCYYQEYAGAFNMTPVVYAPLVVTGNVFADFDLEQRLKMPSYPYPGDQRKAVNVTIDGEDPAAIVAREYHTLQTFLDVYPDAGMLLEGAARLQSNVWFQPPSIVGCENSFKIFHPKHDAATNTTSYFPETLMPVFYLSREAVVSDTLATYIQDNVLIFFTLVHALGGVFIALGALCAAGAAVVWNSGSRKHVVAAASHHHPNHHDTFGAADDDTMPSVSRRNTPRMAPAVPQQEANGPAPGAESLQQATAFTLRKRAPPLPPPAGNTRGSGGSAW